MKIWRKNNGDYELSDTYAPGVYASVYKSGGRWTFYVRQVLSNNESMMWTMLENFVTAREAKDIVLKVVNKL